MYEEFYRPYLSLTAEQRKLLCFLAYTNSETEPDVMSRYRHVEGFAAPHLKELIKSVEAFLEDSRYYYLDQYCLSIYHRLPLVIYLLCENPLWLREFDEHYKELQKFNHDALINALRLCIAGKELPNRKPNLFINNEQRRIMVPLSAHEAFLPLLSIIPPASLADFIGEVLLYRAENDLPADNKVLLQLVNQASAYIDSSTNNRLRSAIGLYDYYFTGRYDALSAVLNPQYGNLMTSLRALYAEDYNKAYSSITLALRERNRDAVSFMKGFFEMVLHNYVLVMALHFKTDDHHKKLAATLKKDYFLNNNDNKLPALLADYLVNGSVPTAKELASLRKVRGKNASPLQIHLIRMASCFFKIPVDLDEGTQPVPRMALLRHELSKWLQLPDGERQRLERDFGGKPLLERIHFKQPWELLIDELTPAPESGQDASQEPAIRVMYLVNNDHVEVREQTRLKSGMWGSGKKLSIENFVRGTDYMNDADRQIASKLRNYYYDIDVKYVLPHLIGSDRVYTGYYAPYDHVTIEEEKPYLMIERTGNEFVVKSNLDGLNLSNTVLYRRVNAYQYTVFTLTPQQRTYYQKLLSLGTFPLEAEPLLRQFLPKVSNVVEVHSDLVEGGSTLQHRDGSAVLCLQVSPTTGSRNFFTVYCMARPLPDGVTLFDPATGLNPCVAEANGTRYQVTRDMRGERENLTLLRTFIDDNQLNNDLSSIDEPFADRRPVILSAEALLQLMLYVQQQGASHFVIEWPEGGQLSLKTADTTTWNIGLKSKNGWFEVEGDVPVDDDTVLTASQLLQLVSESSQKGFIRLAEGEFLAITERLRKQLARLESLTTNNRGHLIISELHATLLSSALSGEIDIRHDNKINKLQDKIERSMQQQPVTPKTLHAELRDYQHDGYKWICRMTSWGAGVCLADDMGLGKTIQTIAFLLHTCDQGPALVAAPASVVLNWRRELERFAPSLNVAVLNTATDRQRIIEDAKGGDVILSTYGLFVTESEHLQNKEWNTVCLDEAHVIKNRETKTSQVAMQLKASHRIILTGTPVQNHLGELWNLFQFINPGLLGSYDQFSQKYIIPIEQQDAKERSRQLKRIVQPFILRRTKQEVVEELPPKTEVILPVELSDEEMAIYEVIRRRAKEMLEEEASGSPSVNTLAEITRLRQAACAPQLAEKSWKGGESTKIAVLMQLIDEIVAGGNSVLVFSQFTSFLALVRQALDARRASSPSRSDDGKEPETSSYAYLDGSVPMRQRDQLVQDFQRGRQQVFLISLKAGGLGLNLTGANYVIHLDPWWNPAIEQQATDRAYRIGQRQNVTVYHLISQHTIEEKILRLHETKRNLADQMLSGTSQSHKLTAKDLLDMLNV